MYLKKFITLFILIFLIDQAIKWYILGGFRWSSECISIVLVFNEGVAFSMFAFLEEKLKYIQIVLILAITLYSFYDKMIKERFILPIGIIVGAGSSNILDRFIHGGVVDYVYWHCYFDFAIFNFADMMINFAVFIIILTLLKKK